MELLGMDGVSIWVGDLDRGSAFYGLVLGLEECHREPGMVAFEVGLETLTLRDWPAAHGTPLPAPSGGCVPVLQVDDLEALVRRLESAGAAVTSRSPDEAGALGISFEDPDGNEVSVVCMPGDGSVMMAEAKATGEAEA